MAQSALIWSSGLAGGLLLTSLGTLPAAMAGTEPVMRVLLREAPELRLRADANQPLMLRGVGSEQLRVKGITVRLGSGQLLLELVGAPRRQVRLAHNNELRVSSDDPRGIWLGRHRYQGELRLRAKGRAVQVINHLGVESYLASVVGSEMPAKWPLAALQAQAVAARTYALRQIGKPGEFDLKASVASQVYLGLESETASTRQAVNSTRSLVLVHGRRLIDAVFHSSSGGATEASGAVWKYQHPYLVSVPAHDQHSPVHRWKKGFDRQQLAQAFREIGGVRRIDSVSTSSTGRVRQAKVYGPSGALLLSGKELRRRLGLKSTLIRFEMLAPNAPAGRSGVLRAGALRSQQAAPAKSFPPLKIYRYDSATGAPMPVVASSTSRPFVSLRQGLPVKGSQAVLLIHGQGNGHGVGMSQWGAQGLAERGADFRQILRHYYRGVEIRPYRQLQDPSLVRKLPLAPVWNG